MRGSLGLSWRATARPAGLPPGLAVSPILLSDKGYLLRFPSPPVVTQSIAQECTDNRGDKRRFARSAHRVWRSRPATLPDSNKVTTIVLPLLLTIDLQDTCSLDYDMSRS